ncbi:hypothetical protein BD626DRAFT_499923 [Schizophyllum amplum]|uniref:TIGR04076 family protein n=1 Tax=Schizophyllum amplum TaxID=97359 RepID=A0A550CBP1_9AGAR|nr:hypothetical protein BD626DRAFT_499923 [Auriculariopsis ampla]
MSVNTALKQGSTEPTSPASISQAGSSASQPATPQESTYQLFDLRVEVVCPPGERILCGARDGDHFLLVGEMLSLPPGQAFSIYSLGSILPLLSGMQRTHQMTDWMTSETEIACPDPLCKSKLRIKRTGLRTFGPGNVSLDFTSAETRSEED